MDPIQDLVRDFAAQVSAMTKEFERRVARVAVAAPSDEGSRSPGDLAKMAAEMLAHRRSRKTFFAADLFHEPAWDMLLALYVAHQERRTLFVKALVGNSDAPATTSQRWIDHLHRLGLVERIVDPSDRRRIEISLSDAGELAMTRYLCSLSDP